MGTIELLLSPEVSDEELNALFASAWEGHRHRSFRDVLSRSLLYVCAYADRELVGFVNVAWDGGVHGFILDTTVHRKYQRQGIGVKLVKRAAERAATAGLEWLHVDFEPHLEDFYRACGFVHTEAGLLRLDGANLGSIIGLSDSSDDQN